MYEFLQYQVRDAMTVDPIAISPRAKLREAEMLFETHDFNGVPVVDEQRHLLGVLTKFDLLKAFTLDSHAIAPHYDDIMEQWVETVMTPDSVSVDPQLPLSRLLQKQPIAAKAGGDANQEPAGGGKRPTGGHHRPPGRT